MKVSVGAVRPVKVPGDIAWWGFIESSVTLWPGVIMVDVILRTLWSGSIVNVIRPNREHLFRARMDGTMASEDV